MTSKQKVLGTGLEDRVVHRATAAGLRARKQPLSGALTRTHPNDVVVDIPGDDRPSFEGADLLVECKVRSATVTPTGDKTLRIDLGWYDAVRANAARLGFREGVVVVNAKHSRHPMVLCDLDHYLTLLRNFA